ncbi:MAG: hypothetical protein AAGA77_06810 [Bacteroidota bacterium]
MKDLRKYIHDAANEHHETVDNDALWQGIELKMKKPKKKRRILLFLFLSGIMSLIVISALGYYIWITPNPSQTVATETIPIQDLDEVGFQNLASQDTRINKPANSSNVYLNTTKEEIYPTNTNALIHMNTNTKTINNSGSTSPEKDNVKNASEHFFDNNKASSTATHETALFPFSGKISEPKKVDVVNQNWLEIPTLESLFVKEVRSSKNNVFDLPRVITPPQSYPDQNVSFLRSLTIYGQYGFGNKTIFGETGNAAERNKTEKLLEQVRIGLEANLIHVSDFILYGGVSFVSINDIVEVEESYFEDREITYLKTIIQTDNGEQYEFSTENLPHLITKEATRFNSHRMLSIPVGFGFGKEFSGIYLGLGFGLDFNYSFSDIHTIISLDNQLIDYTTKAQWLDPSLHTTISLDFPVHQNWFIHSKVMYRNTSIKNEVLGVNFEEKYSLYGIDLGLKLCF